MVSCMINMMEQRDVSTEDIPRTFLHTKENSGSTHVKLDSLMLELLEEIELDLYKKYIVT